jgi:hypothetical protein
MVKLEGKYKGYKYKIDTYGYGYKIYKPNGLVETFNPYFGNTVLDIADTDERIKFTRKRVYNRIETLIKRKG